MRISKCPFPRHGIVFFDGDNNPVASANICFQCGDILVWPPYLEDETVKYAMPDEESDDPPLFMLVHEEVLGLWDQYFFGWVKVPKSGF